MQTAMRIYLKVVNPAIAVIVFLLCFWAAIWDKSSFALYGMVAGGMTTYFFAKGIFSASAVFILGKILLQILGGAKVNNGFASTRSEALYCAGLIGLTLSLLIGLWVHRPAHEKRNSAYETVKVVDPAEIAVVEHYVVKGVQPLRISGKLKNNSSYKWDTEVSARIFVDGRYAAGCNSSAHYVSANTEHDFTVVCKELNVIATSESIRYQLHVSATRSIPR
jgi:hypothetical protein